jgi:hypothetical protein
MVQSTAPRLRFQFFRLRQQAAAGPGLGLDGILPEAMVRQVLEEEGARWKRIFYTPWLTFWAFFWQALSPDHSCRAAVKRIAAWLGSTATRWTTRTPARTARPARGCPNRSPSA